MLERDQCLWRACREQSPRQRRKNQLRNVGRDCQRQGGKQDRVGDPGKREFQEDDNMERCSEAQQEEASLSGLREEAVGRGGSGACGWWDRGRGASEHHGDGASVREVWS